MKRVKIYLDICCFNRPYDDPYMLEFENAKNPFVEKRNTIMAFKQFANEIIRPNQAIEETAKYLQSKGLKNYDALHIACAIFADCDYFLTVDDRILNQQCKEVKITDPVVFVNQWLKKGVHYD